MKILLVSFFIFFTLSRESFSQSKDVNKKIKSNEQKTLEILDGLCLQNTDDFSNIDRISKAVGYIKVPNSIQDADLAYYKNGGSSYYGDLDGLKFMIGYIKNGGCTVALKSVNANKFIKILAKNFKIKYSYKITEGVQIQEFFNIEKGSIYAGGIFIINYGKPEARIETLSVSYLPSEAFLKIKSQNK